MKTLERFGNWLAILLFMIIAATLIIFLYDFYSNITKSTKSAAEEHLMQNTRTSATLIREKLQGDLDTIFALSGLLSHMESIDSPEAKLLLKNVGNELPFSALMVRSNDGGYYTNNGAEINTSQTQYLIGPALNKKGVNVIYKKALYDRDMIAFESPIIQNGKNIGVVSGLYYTNYINNILENSGSNKHQYQIVDRSGNYILTSDLSVFQKDKNLYGFLNGAVFSNENNADQILRDFIERKSGVSTYVENNRTNYFCYIPIGIKDWYLISTAPDTGINLQTISMQNPTVKLAIRVIILFIIIILYIAWRQIKYRVTMEKNKKELEILNRRLQKRNKSLKLKAENDLLTGFFNKVTSERAISEFLSNEGKEGRHALFIIDIDDFKRINDELGHLIGDKALTDAVNRIDHCLRTTDIKGRIGGDEFIILLKNVSSDEIIEQKAAEICSILNEIKLTEDSLWKLSGSIGAAIYPDHAENFKDLFLKADRAMYFSKELGKGTYYIYRDDDNLQIKEMI